MLALTEDQRFKVEANINLVGKVIQDCVHTLYPGCIYDYDELYQIGCVGLCKAAQTDKADHPGAFSTYAYRLICNEIYSHLEYATRRGREQATAPEEMPCMAMEDESLEQQEACLELMHLLEQAEAKATGVTAKGFQAIRLLAQGYSNRDIGERFGVPANHITAWVSKARRAMIELKEVN